MAILEKEVWVNCGNRNDIHYEKLGYNITKRKNNQGKVTVPPNTRILVKLEHLPSKSGIKVTKICDICGESFSDRKYCQIIIDREKNEGKDYCRSCSSKKMNATRLENIKYEQSLEYFANNNNKEYLLVELSNKNLKKASEIFKSSGLKYIWNCSICKSEYTATAANRTNGNNCPYCAGQKVNHTNCLWTTHPEIANLLKYPKRGYKITYGRSYKEWFVCNKCKHESEKEVCNVVNQGLSCLCSDGISYPEKFMMGVLNQLDINYKTQVRFNWSKTRRYDFYIPSLNCIIETHGLQHYEKGFKNNNDQKQIDKLKEKIASENGINNYVTIDCRYSEINYIKKNIINNLFLSSVFELGNIDWLKCHEYACSSFVKTVCELWNNGIKSTLEISKMLNLGRNTVNKYLKQGVKLNICDYNPNENKGSLKEERIIVQLSLDGEFIKEYRSLSKASKEIAIKRGTIWSCCQGKLKTAGDYRWMYKDDYIQLKEKLPPIEKPKYRRKIIQLSKDELFVREWESAREVERTTGINNSAISNCLRGRTLSSYGFKWMYKEDYEKLIENK